MLSRSKSRSSTTKTTTTSSTSATTTKSMSGGSNNDVVRSRAGRRIKLTEAASDLLKHHSNAKQPFRRHNQQQQQQFDLTKKQNHHHHQQHVNKASSHRTSSTSKTSTTSLSSTTTATTTTTTTSEDSDYQSRTSSESSSSASADPDPRLTLQKVRVELEKIPEDDVSLLLSNNRKRKSSTDSSQSLSESDCKRLFRQERKENLDRFLNLKPEHENDLYLLSQLKQLNEKRNSANGASNSVHDEDEADDEVTIKCLLLSNNQTSSNNSETSSTVTNESASVIRFPPPKQPNKESVFCKWKDCGEVLESTSKLLDHLNKMHVATQIPPPEKDDEEEGDEDDSEDEFQYKCLWIGCKVFGKGSSSKTWLEKHALNHGGNKPFQCIVDGCNLRFGTQTLLERHVNNHFKKKNSAAENGENGNGSGTGNEEISNSALKLIRKVSTVTGKKLKLRKTIYSARIFDLFDMGVMARLREQLAQMQDAMNEIVSDENQSDIEVTFTSKIIARRKETGTNETVVLLSWTPENILPDEWVEMKKASKTKSFKLSTLPPSAKEALSSRLNVASPSSATGAGSTHGRKMRHPEHNTDSIS